MKTLFLLSEEKQIVLLPAGTVYLGVNHEETLTEPLLVIVHSRSDASETLREARPFTGGHTSLYILAVDTPPAEPYQCVKPLSWPMRQIGEFAMVRDEWGAITVYRPKPRA